MCKREKSFFYDEFADSFDKAMNMYDTNKRINIVFEDLLLPNLRDRKVLDAGCGTGWFSKVAIDRGGDVVSMDIGMNLLRKVKEKCNSKRVVGDLLNLPFQPNSFEIVICSEAIEHTLDPKRAFEELIRVLAKGGTLALTIPNKFWFWSVWLANRLRLRPYEGIENWCGWKEIKQWCKENSLLIEDMHGFHLFPFILPFTHKILDFFDRHNKRLSPFMLNIALKAKK